MNEQTLERLLIDDAIGALPPDHRELLAAYTAATGSDSQRLLWEGVAAAARDALPAEPARSIPEFPIHTLRIHQLLRAALFGVAAAAMLLIGMAIGTRFVAQTPLPPSPSVVISAPAQAAPVPRNAGVPDIWSSSRLVAMALQRQNAPVALPRWTSLFR
jgi:hypothetical protein